MARNLVFAALTALALLVGGVVAAPSEAQGPPQALPPGVKTTFVRLGQGEPGVLYEPVTPGPKSQIAVFAMHSAGDYLTHSSCTELSKRGYRVLCANNSNSKSGMFNDGVLDKVMLQVKAAIQYLRRTPGVTKIVLWGHSGGATVMTAYQNIAENGVKICQDAAKVMKCPDTLAGMPPADGVILGDPNWGLSLITVLGIDPSVTDGQSGMTLNPDLDMFNPKNGFTPGGANYSADFTRRFQAAQAKRYNALVTQALGRLKLIEAGKGYYSDDEPFTIAGASFTENKLYAQDLKLSSRTMKPQMLLHADGKITTGIVPSVRVPTLSESPSHSYVEAALKTTVRGFLNTYAMRVTDDFGYDDRSIRGVVWNSSWANNPGNAEGIAVPFLTMGMTGSFEAGSAETISDHVKSADKTLIFVEGASHGYPACKKCEKTPGQFGDTVKTLYDYADGWLSKPGRFM
jgi:hypothetical protein